MARAVSRVAPKSKPPPQLPASLTAELERRRAGLARHMARAVVAVVKWDDSTGVPPQREAIAKTCEAGLDLCLAARREARPADPRGVRSRRQSGNRAAEQQPVGRAGPRRVSDRRAGRMGRHP